MDLVRLGIYSSDIPALLKLRVPNEVRTNGSVSRLVFEKNIETLSLREGLIVTSYITDAILQGSMG